MKTTTQKPTLESLGISCAIESRGISAMNEGERPMLKWEASFWRTNKTQASAISFDYFTGSGCGPKPTQKQFYDAVASFPGFPKSSDVECRAALVAATKANWKPDAIEILWAIARDGDTMEMTFEDWANELGYDVDSRKAEKVYRACQDNALRLRKILSAEQVKEVASLEI